jgi:3-oxoacyl-(acyl-carrier-protein) synthase
MPAEDRREASSLSAAFGAHRPVTALTGAIGFVGAATALVQVVVALSALASRLVPPVARLERPQQALPIDLVFGSPRPLAGQASDTAVCTTRTFWGEHALVWVRGVGGGEMKNWELGTEK